MEPLETNTVSLDPNHTHFILVDDGTERQFGGEIDFRSMLEKYISEMKTIGGKGNPHFVVAVEFSFAIVKL